MKYYKSSKGYYYKKSEKGRKIRISFNEYIKATQKGGTNRSVVTYNNSIERDVEDKRENLVYTILNKIFPIEIVSLFISGCGKDGFYKSDIKICYNEHEKILKSKENNRYLNSLIKELFKSIEEWYSFSSTISLHITSCNFKFKNKSNNNNWILYDYRIPNEPKTRQSSKRSLSKLMKYNQIFTPIIKDYFYDFFSIFEGIKIKSYCRTKNLDQSFDPVTNKLRLCYVVQHPNGNIMSLREFSKLFDNNFQYISNNAEYIFKENGVDVDYVSKYPFSGMTHIVSKDENGNLINKKYEYTFNNINNHYNDDDINNHYNDDDIKNFNFKLFE